MLNVFMRTERAFCVNLQIAAFPKHLATLLFSLTGATSWMRESERPDWSLLSKDYCLVNPSSNNFFTWNIPFDKLVSADIFFITVKTKSCKFMCAKHPSGKPSSPFFSQLLAKLTFHSRNLQYLQTFRFSSLVRLGLRIFIRSFDSLFWCEKVLKNVSLPVTHCTQLLNSYFGGDSIVPGEAFLFLNFVFTFFTPISGGSMHASQVWFDLSTDETTNFWKDR